MNEPSFELISPEMYSELVIIKNKQIHYYKIIYKKDENFDRQIDVYCDLDGIKDLNEWNFKKIDFRSWDKFTVVQGRDVNELLDNVFARIGRMRDYFNFFKSSETHKKEVKMLKIGGYIVEYNAYGKPSTLLSPKTKGIFKGFADELL